MVFLKKRDNPPLVFREVILSYMKFWKNLAQFK